MVDDSRRHPRRCGGVRLRQAAGNQERAERERRRRPARGGGQRAAVLLAVQLPERRRRDRPAARAGRRARPPDRDCPGLGRHPFVVDTGARRQDRRHSRSDQSHVVHSDESRRLHRPLRRALRRPARGDADVGRGTAAQRVRAVGRAASRAAAERHRQEQPRPGGVDRRLREVPRPGGPRLGGTADRRAQPRFRTKPR